MQDFENIRPFLDAEVNDAITKLLADQQFILAIRRLRFHYLPRFFDHLLLPITRFILHAQLKNVQSLLEFQRRMSYYVDYMVKTQVDNLTVSGLEELDFSKNYLFISNHRDITLDAALVDCILLNQSSKTLRIAIGDNLLQSDFVRLLLRLNKCFKVKRPVVYSREFFKHLHQLSAYINFCLKDDCHSVWLAQSAGRAKDGLDKTDPAIIKMLAMNKACDMDFSSYITNLHIVPISISYEYDPCDVLKAQELYTSAVTGKYVKAVDEDFTSIGTGILGYKGNVHIAFGRVLQGDFANADAVAGFIDQQIITNYQLHASNLLAYEILHGHLPLGLSCNAEQRRFFENRLSHVPIHLRDYWLMMYANPVVSKLALTHA